MSTSVVVGLQWGDEGKGKIIDILSENVTHIVRAQGGNNAGHTVITEQGEFHFHLIPSGILYSHTRCYIGSGTVIDLESLLLEIETLEKNKVETEGRLFVSPLAHVVLPLHKKADLKQETSLKGLKIGTTGRGIGPCYADKAKRLGVRLLDLQNPDELKKKLVRMFSSYGEDAVGVEETICLLEKCMEKLSAYVTFFEEDLWEACKAGQVLVEGAQGAMLDIGYGTYPFVTSSQTLSAGACIGAGISPNSVSDVIGVIKAYTTRVGMGPFPTEMDECDLKGFVDHHSAREFGTTTGRKRRMGWFDAVIGRFSCKLNGVTKLAVTKLDILDDLEEIKVCVGYNTSTGRVDRFSEAYGVLDELTPIYEKMPGWKSSTKSCTSLEELPKEARAYLQRIENLCDVEIKYISTGPSRNEIIIKEPQLSCQPC